MIEKIISTTNIHYNKAVLEKNGNQQILIKKYQLILFIVLHEIVYSYIFYDQNIKKVHFKDALNVLFRMDDFKKLDGNNDTNKLITKYFLFNIFDIFNTLCSIDHTIQTKVNNMGFSFCPKKLQKHNQEIKIKKELELFIQKTS